MADLINELARMTAFFQVRTVARVIGADPDRVSREPDGSIRLRVEADPLIRPMGGRGRYDPDPYRSHHNGRGNRCAGGPLTDDPHLSNLHRTSACLHMLGRGIKVMGE